MKFFIENKELDDTIKEIRKKIRLSMNGEVSAAMRKRGITYKINFGVSIPRLREIAREYEPNHDLAQRLWAFKIRETMILATLLQPAEKFSKKNADEWLQSVIHTELAEQISMNLLAKLPYAGEFSMDLIHSEELWRRIVGFMLAARVWKVFSKEQVVELTNVAVKLSDTDELQLYKSIALALSRICRQNKQIAETILAKLNAFENSEKVSERYIYMEVRNEVDFLT